MRKFRVVGQFAMGTTITYHLDFEEAVAQARWLLSQSPITVNIYQEYR